MLMYVGEQTEGVVLGLSLSAIYLVSVILTEINRVVVEVCMDGVVTQ